MKDNFEERLYPPDIGMSPSFAIGRFNSAIRKYGQDVVLTDFKFKKAREIWTTAAFFLGLSKITGKTYWVIPEYEAATPDTYAVSFTTHPKYKDGKIREMINVEVSRYEEHAKENLVATIKGKLIDKHYPDYYILLVQVSRPGEKIDVDDVFSQLSKEKIGVSEIWLLGKLQDDPNGKYVVACLFSQRAGTSFYLNKELENRSIQTQMIRMSRGVGESAPELYLVVELPELPMP